MLRYTFNVKDCVSNENDINITNIIKEGDNLLFQSDTNLLLKEGDLVFFQRKYGDEIIFRDRKEVISVDGNAFKTTLFENKVTTVYSCTDEKDVKLPFNGGTVNALKFVVDDIFSLTNKDNNIKQFYSNSNDNTLVFKHCNGDYVRYDELFLLKSDNVENNVYTSFEEKLYNTEVKLYFYNSKTVRELNCVIPISYEGIDSKTVLYWIYDNNNEGEVDVKTWILKNYEKTHFFHRDERFIKYVDNGISLTKDLGGIVDTRIFHVTNDIKFNIPINNDFNSALLQNELYDKTYIESVIEENINEIVDMEKDIYIPRVKGDGGLVNEIIIKPNFVRRINEDWINGGILDKYYGSSNLSYTKITDLGFTEDDIKYQKNSLSKSFLRLSFYDTKNRSSQSLLYYSTIFIDTNSIFSEFVINGNNETRVEFKISNSFNYTKSSEGFYLYLFKNLFTADSGATIYMKVEFNHAKYGKTIPLLLPKSENFKNGYIDGENIDGIKNLFDDLYIEINIKYDKKKNEYIWFFVNDSVNDCENHNITLELYEPIVNKK
jgi:hypothetical protein